MYILPVISWKKEKTKTSRKLHSTLFSVYQMESKNFKNKIKLKCKFLGRAQEIGNFIYILFSLQIHGIFRMVSSEQQRTSNRRHKIIELVRSRIESNKFLSNRRHSIWIEAISQFQKHLSVRLTDNYKQLTPSILNNTLIHVVFIVLSSELPHCGALNQT